MGESNSVGDKFSTTLSCTGICRAHCRLQWRCTTVGRSSFTVVTRRPAGSRLPCPHRGHCLSSGRDNNRSNLKLEIEHIHVSRLRPRLRQASHSPGRQNGRKRRATIHEAILRPQPEPAISMIRYCRQLRRSHRSTKPKPPFPVPTLAIGQMSHPSSCAAAKGQISSHRFPARPRDQSPPVYWLATASTSLRSSDSTKLDPAQPGESRTGHSLRLKSNSRPARENVETTRCRLALLCPKEHARSVVTSPIDRGVARRSCHRSRAASSRFSPRAMYCARRNPLRRTISLVLIARRYYSVPPGRAGDGTYPQIT